MSAYDWLGSLAVRPLGFLVVGPLAAALGVDVTLWLAAGGLAAATALTLSVPSVRRLGRPEPISELTSADAALAGSD